MVIGIRCTRPNRRGLSTLEMVLTLPVLLMLMALMVNFGTVAAWKVRGLTVARHQLWASRWPRNASLTPPQRYWPPPGSVGQAATEPMAPLDLPEVHLQVARGPDLPLGGVVNEPLLDPTLGSYRSDSEMKRAFAMLASLGSYRLKSHSELLDNKWQFQRMYWQEQETGIPWNDYRRIPVIYGFPNADPALMQAYVQAVVAIYYAPFRQDLFPLDRDDEFIAYGRRFRWGGAPDFHPDLEQYCGLNHEVVRRLVDRLILHIKGGVETDENGQNPHPVPGVALTMTDAFLALYRHVIQTLQGLLDAEPPPSSVDAAAMKAEIAELEGKIQILEKFRATLQNDG